MKITKLYVAILLVVLFLLLIMGCGKDPVAGGSEVGNPVVAGIVRDSLGNPLSHVSVRLVPREANPVSSDSSKMMRTTTDANGAYYFDNIRAGEYNVILKKSDVNLGGLNSTVNVDDQDTLWSVDTLSEMGALMLTVSKESLEENSFLYFEGTDFFSAISQAVELEDGSWGVLFDEIPIHDDLELFYFNESQISILLDSMLTIIPDDTITIHIFDARLVYHTKNSNLPEDHIYRVETDNNGTLWALTWNFQLGYFDGSTWTESNPMGAYTIEYIDKDAMGNLYVATRDKGIMVQSESGWTQVVTLCPFLVEDLVIKENGVLWAVSPYGLHYWDTASQQWVMEIDMYTYIADSTRVTTLKEAPDGSLWIGTSYGLVTYKDGIVTHHKQIDDLYMPYITSLEIGEEGSVWIGTDFGVYSYRDGLYSNVDISGQMWDVVSLYRDSQGGLWCGTGWDGFLLKLEDSRWKIFDIYAFELGAYIGLIHSICEKDGHLFVGTEKTGVVEIWDSPGGRSEGRSVL